MAANWYALSETENGEAEVNIYDEIGSFGVGAKQFLSDIQKLAGKKLHVRINSPGGSVTEGTAIFNALRRHPGGVTVHIDALAASMASVIAMAGAPVLMADNALLMIHNPWTVSMGSSDELRKDAEILDKLKVNLRNAYVRKTGMTEERVQEMMDAETWLDSVESVALGFADAIEDGIEAAATVTPDQLKARFDKFAKNMATPSNEETPAVEPVVEPVTEPAPVVVEPTVEEPAPVIEEVVPVETSEGVITPDEPQALASTLIIDRFAALKAERDQFEAKVSELTGKCDILTNALNIERENITRLEESLGLAPANIVPAVGAGSDAAPTIVEQFNAITDPEAKSAFYRKHSAELIKALPR